MTILAIVILNWNGKHHLERFLPTLKNESREEGVKIVIADNGSTDGSQEWLKEQEGVELLFFDKNWGYSGGYNRALAQVEANYFLLLNSDIEVTPGWLTPLLEAMEQNSEMGIAMPKINQLEQRDHFEYAGAAGGFIDILGYPFCRGRILSYLERDEGQYDDAREVFWASGAALLIRSELFCSLGGFDERFFAHMEEIDLCWRAKREGWQVWVIPHSKVYHLGGGTLPNDSSFKLFLNYRNNLLMLYKNLPNSHFIPLFFIRFAMDAFSSLLYIFQGKIELVRSLFRGYSHFLKLRKVSGKSVEVGGDSGARGDGSKVKEIYRGSIIFSFFLAGQKLKFSKIEGRLK